MAKLRHTNITGVYLFLCPGCRTPHYVNVSKLNGWGSPYEFNGDKEKPTLSPAVKTGSGATLCIGTIKEGKISFSPDSTHELAGQKVAMIEI